MPLVSRDTTRTRLGAVLALAAGTLVLTACGGSLTPAEVEPRVIDSDLAAAGCPDDIRVQLDGMPSTEHGFLFALLGDDPEPAPDGLSITGPLTARGVDTGVALTVLSGTPEIANSALVDEPTTLLALVDLDATNDAAVGIFAPVPGESAVVAVLSTHVTDYADCLTPLVPILQNALLDALSVGSSAPPSVQMLRAGWEAADVPLGTPDPALVDAGLATDVFLDPAVRLP